MIKRSLKNIASFAHVINGVATYWPDSTHSVLWWDDHRQLFFSSRNPDSYYALSSYATRAMRRARVIFPGARNSFARRRWFGPFDLGLWLPSDAVIIGPNRARGPIIASKKSARILKLVAGRTHLQTAFNNEVSALKMAEVAGLNDHVPFLYEHGVAGCGTQWMMGEFVPNTRGFMCTSNPLHYQWVWLRWLSRVGLPFLSRFYHASGPQIISEDKAINALEHQMGSDAEMFRPIFDWVTRIDERGSSTQIIRARVHGDLGPAHVHRNGALWKILDWGTSEHREIFYEVLHTYWRNPHSPKPANVSFWNWLITGEPPVPIEVTLLLDIHAKDFDIFLGSEAFRRQMLIVMLSEIVSAHKLYREAFHTELVHEHGAVKSRATVRTAARQFRLLIDHVRNNKGPIKKPLMSQRSSNGYARNLTSLER